MLQRVGFDFAGNVGSPIATPCFFAIADFEPRFAKVASRREAVSP